MQIDGKKSYLVGLAMIAYGAIGLATAWIDQETGSLLIGNGAGIMGLRHAISKLVG